MIFLVGKKFLLADLNASPAIPQQQPFGLRTSKLFKEDICRRSVSVAGNATQASTATTQENVLEWVKQDKRRMLHVVYRVGDLDRTIKYISFM